MPRVKELKYRYMFQDIGMIIDGHRRRKGMKQCELADDAGMSQQLYSYKVKHNAFDYVDLIRLFNALELTDEEIVRLMKV